MSCLCNRAHASSVNLLDHFHPSSFIRLTSSMANSFIFSRQINEAECLGSNISIFRESQIQDKEILVTHLMFGEKIRELLFSFPALFITGWFGLPFYYPAEWDWSLVRMEVVENTVNPTDGHTLECFSSAWKSDAYTYLRTRVRNRRQDLD